MIATRAVSKTGREVSKSAAQGRRELSRNRDDAVVYCCVLVGSIANWGMNWGTPRQADDTPSSSQISRGGIADAIVNGSGLLNSPEGIRVSHRVRRATDPASATNVHAAA